MITLACGKCGLAMRTSGDPQEVDFLIGTRSQWYPDSYPCPGCDHKMGLYEALGAEDAPYFRVHDMSPQEIFQALHGMGLPEEKVCNAEELRKVIEGRVVKALELQDLPGENRSVLHSLMLDSGVRVYLAASPLGSVIYRVAPPRSHVKELENG